MRGLSESSSYVTIDIESLEIYLKSNDKDLSSICRVKKYTGETVYDPIIVSIGPYHHGKDFLQPMIKKKWNCMDCILKLSGNRNLKDYIKSLKKVEHLVRRYYNEAIQMESNEFVNMLMLDGLFVLISIYAIEVPHDYKNLEDSVSERDENNELDQALEYCFIAHDILLIENQIPFLALKNIHELFIDEEITAPQLSDKICHYIEQILFPFPISIKETNRPKDFHHLLHLCHVYLKPSQNEYSNFMKSNQDNGMTICWRKAAQYDIAGVKIKKREFHENNPHSLLDVRFANNMLEIPYILLDENTSLSLFKNLIALEQTNPKFGNDITAYVIFMYHLVKDAKDVALLVSKGIIDHKLRNEEEVVDLFTRLSENVIFDFTDKFYLKHICHNLEAYYQSHMKWWNWNVWFRRTTSVLHGGIWKIRYV